MDRELVIDGESINDASDCYVIAEIGHNHQGSLQTAKELFRQAKACGANAVKLQKRDNRGLYTKAAYEKAYNSEASFGSTYGEHREALEFGEKEYRELARLAKELGLAFFATAFDSASAEFLHKLDMPAFKIASGDIKSIPLLKQVASYGKPMIISTGGAELADVKRAYDAIRPINEQIAILQCTASYPAEFEQLDLRVIETYRKAFPDAVVGLSAHDNGIAMSVVAYVLGSRIVEKHFTLNRAMRGTDHAFSLEPVGLSKMVRDLRRAKVAMGDGAKRIHETEVAPIVKMSKKIVAARDLAAGHVLTASDLTFKSPGDGLFPYQLNDVMGRTLLRPLKTDDPLTLDLVSDGTK